LFTGTIEEVLDTSRCNNNVKCEITVSIKCILPAICVVYQCKYFVEENRKIYIAFF